MKITATKTAPVEPEVTVTVTLNLSEARKLRDGVMEDVSWDQCGRVETFLCEFYEALDNATYSS